MLKKSEIKKAAKNLGADLCGIAAVERFKDAPEGFHPRDILETCQSVIVLAIRLPWSPLFSKNPVPYTRINNITTLEVDQLAYRLSLYLEDHGIQSVPIPSDDPYIQWDPARKRGKGILSLRHAGYLAGLGVLGKNTLLTNERFGNLIRIGGILTDVPLESDSPVEYQICSDDCNLCIDSCPQSAIDGTTVNQKKCREHSTIKTKKGYTLYQCNFCRRVCPHYKGVV